jgi:hypothetical protein
MSEERDAVRALLDAEEAEQLAMFTQAATAFALPLVEQPRPQESLWPLATGHDKEAGWTLDTAFLVKVKRRANEILIHGHIVTEEVQAVLMAALEVSAGEQR